MTLIEEQKIRERWEKFLDGKLPTKESNIIVRNIAIRAMGKIDKLENDVKELQGILTLLNQNNTNHEKPISDSKDKKA